MIPSTYGTLAIVLSHLLWVNIRHLAKKTKKTSMFPFIRKQNFFTVLKRCIDTAAKQKNKNKTVGFHLVLRDGDITIKW